MGLFGLFGGKKTDEAKAAPAAAEVKAAEKAKAAEAVKPAEKTAKLVEKAKPVVSAAVVAGAAPGAEQVKLRLKLAAAKRTGQTAAAYAAAKGLADIQAKAGRRLGARLWAQEADRILARDPKAA